MTWLTDILNSILTFFDRIVYGLISTLYELLIYLANLDLFGMSTITSSTTPNENIIVNFSSRIYALLGIFMLFKISFSILQYMVNPDDFSDKGKGFGKLVTNVLVSLVLIITVPYIFQKAYQIQGIILADNTLGKLILGQSNSENVAEGSTNAEMAEDLQFLVYGTFFSVKTDVLPSCESGPVLGTKAMAQNRECLDDLAELLPDGANKLGDFFTADNPDRRFDAFGEVVNTKNGDNQYVFNYMPVISTIAGGFIVVMLLSFCFDVAVRIIKLGFLEIIAPIPIISYMDPKQSSKDGMLGKWGKECLSTYLSLFIRIAIIYFAFFVIDLVANQLLASPSDQIYLNNQAPEGLMAVFVQVMVILGVLLFAKEVPKLLENLIPGMSGSGNFNINPIKKIKESPLAAGVVGGVVGAGVGGITSAAAAFSASRDEGATRTAALKHGIGGAFSGTFRGAKAGAFSGGKGIVSKSADVAGRVGRNAALKTNTTFVQRMGAYGRQAVGMQSKKEGFDKQIGYHESIQKHASNMEARARDQLSKKSDDWKLIEAQRAQLQQQYSQKADIKTGEMETYIGNDGIMKQREKIIKAGSKEYDDYYTKKMSDYWNKQENMVADYVDSNGQILSPDGKKVVQASDYQIGLEKKVMSDEMQENKLQYTKKDKAGNDVKILKDDQKLEDASWSQIKETGKAAEERAARIKNSEDYRDSEVLEKNIRSENRQSMFTSHK